MTGLPDIVTSYRGDHGYQPTTTAATSVTLKSVVQGY